MGREVVEVVYGKHEKIEIIRETSLLGSPKYYVRSTSGKISGGSFDSLAKAVAWAEEKGGK